MSKLTESIYNKNLEVRYDEKIIRLKENKIAKISLKGKIKCPVLNTGISSITCSKLMDHPEWPRGINPDICSECSCFVNLSIKRFRDKKEKE